eukprot:scaffold27964_cov59-Cyclotella_meneghiniana.AAC.1
MSELFKNTNFNEPINGWDVSGVENMRDMFRGARRFNQDLSGWNTERVTDMYGMFSGATAFNSNIGSWNVYRVTTMAYMFENAWSFNGNVGEWGDKTSSVTDMESMFGLAKQFNQDLSGWNTGRVTSMLSMFHYASKFNGDISGWNTERVTTMTAMFRNATAFNNNIGSWNVSSVTTMLYMFRDATKFNQDLSQWNTTSTMDFRYMFEGATAFNQNLCAWKERITYKRFDRWSQSSGGLVDTVEDMFKNSGCTDKESPKQYYFQNFCSVDICPTPTSPDYIEIGSWRIAHICETCEQSHLSISSDNIKTAQIFREDGTVQPGPTSDYNGWGAMSPPGDGPTFSSQGITFGNMAVQISDWRIRQIDNTHMSISHKDGKVARIYMSNEALDGNNHQQYSGWKSDIGDPSCAYLTENYLQIGDWRFGTNWVQYGDAGYILSVSHKGGKATVVYTGYGSDLAVPEQSQDFFDAWKWGYPNAHVIMGSNDGCPSPLTSSPTTSPTASPLTSSPTTSPTSKSLTSSPTTRPTASPLTSSPTTSPTSKSLTSSPTTTPTARPTARPTAMPLTSSPTVSPTTRPTARPTARPTPRPTPRPVAMGMDSGLQG